MMKKLTFALVSAFVLFAFASCNKENDLVSAAKISVDPTTLTFGVSGGATPVYLTANRDWTASVSGTGVTVSPESGSASNDPQAITINAEKNDGKTRTAVVTFSCGNNLEATVNVTVTGALGMAIEDIYKTTAGTVVETSGLVVGVSTRSFIISDETGYLMVYRGDDATEAGAKIGDEVTVEGPVALYGELIQIDEPTSCKVTASGQPVSYPETPTVIDADNISTFDITEVSYIQMSGIYASSQDSKDPNTIYHNITIPGTRVKGSIAYPVADLGLDEMEGHEITVTGFFAGGNNEDYRNILAVDVEDNGELQVDVTTIDKVIEAETGAVVATSGKVTAICTQGIIITDETGSLFIYRGDKGEIGNTVSVKGTKDIYRDGHQIKDAIIEITDGSTAEPEYDPIDLTDPANLDAYVFLKTELVKISGPATVGQYVDIAAGHSKKVSLYGVTASEYSAYNGLDITVVGYIVQLYAGSTFNIVPVSVVSGPFIKVDNNQINLASTATSATINVLSNQTWKVEKSEGNWITGYTESGVNNGEIEVTFAANDGAERSAKFVITAANDDKVTVTLTQSASGVTQQTYSFVAESGLIKGNGVVALGDVEWNVDTDGGFFGYDNNSERGIQVGSSKKPAAYINLSTTGISGTIKSVKVNAAGAKGTDAELSVTVGGAAFGNTHSLTTASADYSFTGSASGEIVIKYSQSAKAAMYLKSIEVVYE